MLVVGGEKARQKGRKSATARAEPGAAPDAAARRQRPGASSAQTSSAPRPIAHAVGKSKLFIA